MSIQSNFLKGVVFGIGGLGIRTVLNIALIPLIIHKLGVEQYGFYIFLLGFLELLIMIDLGLNTGLLNRLSIYTSRQDGHKTLEQLSIGHWLYAAMAVLMFGIGWLSLPWLTSMFHLSPQLETIAEPSYLLILLTGSFCLFGNYYQTIVLAHHQYHQVQVADFLYLSMANIVAAVLLFLGFGIVEILASRLIIIVLRTAYLVLCLSRVEPAGLLPPLCFKWDAIQELFSVSMYSLLLGLSGILAMRIDNLVIAANLTMVDVAIFGIVFRLFGMISEVIDKVSLGITPVMTRFYSLGDTQSTRFIFLRSSNVINLLSLCLLAWVIFYYPQIFTYFSHNEIEIEPTYSLMWIVAVIIWSRCFIRPASNYLFIYNHRVLQIGASLASTVVNVILSVVLVKSLGIVGVALGTLIPMLIEHHVVCVWASCRKLGVSLLEFVMQTYVRLIPAVATCVLLLVGLRAQPLTLGNMYLDMFFFGALAFGAAGLVWLATSASDYERQLIGEQLNRFRFNQVKRGGQHEERLVQDGA